MCINPCSRAGGRLSPSPSSVRGCHPRRRAGGAAFAKARGPRAVTARRRVPDRSPTSEQLLATANDRVVFMTAWSEFTSALNASLGFGDVLRAASVLFSGIFDLNQTVMVVLAASGRPIAVRSILDDPGSVESFPVLDDQSLLARPSQDGAPLLGRAETWQGLSRLAGHDRSGSFVASALESSAGRIGLLIGLSSDAGPIAESLVQAFQDAAAEVAVAIDRVLTFERSRLEAITDPLTELYNRRFFMETLLNEVRKAKRVGYGLGLFMIDIDDFKKVNDTYGHQAGDQVLASLARATERSVRASDVVARYGGEEFAVVLVGCAENALLDLAEKVRASGEAVLVEAALPQRRNITVSVGAAYFDDSSLSPEDLIHSADNALYAAKKSGKNRVVRGARVVK